MIGEYLKDPALFNELGVAGYKGSFNDRLFYYLEDSGFTGSLTDKLAARMVSVLANALRFNGVPLTLDGQYITLTEA